MKIFTIIVSYSSSNCGKLNDKNFFFGGLPRKRRTLVTKPNTIISSAQERKVGKYMFSANQYSPRRKL